MTTENPYTRVVFVTFFKTDQIGQTSFSPIPTNVSS